MSLTETRKADRRKMLGMVESLVTEYGFTIKERKLEPDCFLGKRACYLSFETERGLGLSVDFDGESCQPDTHVLSWHISTDRRWDAVKLADGIFDSVNTIHRHKATDICWGIDNLLTCLRERFTAIRDGSAFLN